MSAAPLAAAAWRAARALAAAALLALSASSAAQGPSGPGLFLWEVASLTNRVYLFGTVHAGKPAWYPLPAPVEAALLDAKVLVVEADITNDAEMAKSAGSASYQPPDSLEKHVAAADYARFRKLLPKYSLREAQLVRFKPFMAVSLLVFSEWARLGYLPQHGVDAYLIRKARAEGKSVAEIEGVAIQAALMDSLTEEENRVAFAGMLGALESGLAAEQITGMVNAWQAGDPDLLLEVARKYNSEVAGAQAFEDKFIWGRHAEMVQKVEGYLAQTRNPHFVAVGALHLAGPQGLVELLRKRGHVVRKK
jgi:hypothetical protein